MAKSEPKHSFRITRVPKRARTPERRAEPEPPAPAPEPTAEPEAAETAPGTEPVLERSAGRFASPSGVLSFLGAVAGARLADEAACRRSPDGEWWAEVGVPWRTASNLVWAAGGTPFAGGDDGWYPVPVSGDVPDARDGSMELDGWAEVYLSELVAETPLRATRPTGTAALDAVVPGPLGRWVLRRATSLGVRASLVPVARRPLTSEREEGDALLLRMRPERGTIPLALVHGICDLPYTVVARPIGTGEENLLVDVRHRPPLTASLLSDMLPEDEIWVLGAPDVGHWRLTPIGDPIEGATLLAPPEVTIAPAPTTTGTAGVRPVPVRLISAKGGSSRVDAVLLDDAELDRLRTFLMGRPLGESAFLIPGNERHLLVSPGGLPGSLPLGVPLCRVGPGALFLEIGTSFHPPLPEGARKEVFGTSETVDRIVAASEAGAWEFDAEHLVPVWALWVGEAPTVQGGLSDSARGLLELISDVYRRTEAERELPIREAAPTRGERVDPVELRKRAQKLAMRGRLVEAAELLERAGDLGDAGRLYEQAATGRRR